MDSSAAECRILRKNDLGTIRTSDAGGATMCAGWLYDSTVAVIDVVLPFDVIVAELAMTSPSLPVLMLQVSEPTPTEDEEGPKRLDTATLSRE